MRVRLLSILPVICVAAFAGDVTVQLSITKRLTRRTVAAASYNLRGTPQPEFAEPHHFSELDQCAVLLEGGSAPAAAPVTVSIAQRNGAFEPDLVVIPAGSTVEFPNFDPIYHNVFSLSKSRAFDLGYYPRSQSRSVTFGQAGIVQVYCHIHAQMYAAIVVTRSPWYGRPGADGTISWKGVPAGRYRALVWHKTAGFHQVAVEVPLTGAVRALVRVPVDTEPVR